MNKTEARLLAKEIIKNMSPEYIEYADKEIFRKVISSEEYKKSNTIFIYVSFKGEPDTKAIIQNAFDNGKRVAVPLCVNDSVIELREICSLDELEKGMYGILEPSSLSNVVSFDEVDHSYIPCLAMDRNGNRLGKGKGYYDRFFENRNKNTTVLCYGKLIFEEIPHEKHDVVFKKIVSEQNAIEY